MDIGHRIRKLRLSQKRTLQDIADGSGFTKSLLSKIENGLVMPPVATLSKIAKTLGVNVSSLLEVGKNTGAIFTPAGNITVSEEIKSVSGYSFYPFASDHLHKKMQPFIFQARLGEVVKHEVSHEGEEFLYVLEGEMKFKVGSIEYTLKAGDSLYFDSIENHGVTPVSDVVRYLDIFVD